MNAQKSFRSRVLDFLERGFASAGKGLKADAWPSDLLGSTSPASERMDERADRTDRKKQPASADDDAT
jgi:hypothetical protein